MLDPTFASICSYPIASIEYDESLNRPNSIFDLQGSFFFPQYKYFVLTLCRQVWFWSLNIVRW